MDHKDNHVDNLLELKSNAIKDEILLDAQKKAARNIKKAETEAKSIKKNAEIKSEEIKSSYLSNAEVKGENESNKIIAGVGLDIKKIRLNSIHEYLEEVALKSIEKLKKLNIDEATNIIKNEIANGCNTIGDSNLLIKLSSKIDKDSISDVIDRDKHQVDIEIVDWLYPGEVIVTNRDQTIRYESVFEEKYKSNKQDLLRVVYNVLFGSADG